MRNKGKHFRRFILWALLGLVLTGSSNFAKAELAKHRIQVGLNLTSRPAEGAPRKEDVYFDQKASLRVKITNLAEPAPNVQVQWVLFYDKAEASGKIERKHLSGSESFSLTRQEEKNFETKPLRLTGKISKKGRLNGMSYVGYGIHVLENGRAVYQGYQPQNLRAEVLEKLGTPRSGADNGSTQKSVTQAGEIASATNPRNNPEAVQPIPPKGEEEKIPVAPAGDTGPFPAAQSGGKEVTLFDHTFSPEETAKILKAANEFSAGELDTRVGLTKTAAQNIVAKRPFSNLDELAKVPYVKKQAFSAFKSFAGKKER